MITLQLVSPAEFQVSGLPFRLMLRALMDARGSCRREGKFMIFLIAYIGDFSRLIHRAAARRSDGRLMLRFEVPDPDQCPGWETIFAENFGSYKFHILESGGAA